MPDLSIGEAARRTGLRASALRYYESLGLLPRARRVSGQRRYEGSIEDRVAVIRFARFTGFTLKEIQELFHGFPERTPPPARWQKLARRKLQDIDALIERAQGMKRLLEAGLECQCLKLEECGAAIRAARQRRLRETGASGTLTS